MTAIEFIYCSAIINIYLIVDSCVSAILIGVPVMTPNSYVMSVRMDDPASFAKQNLFQL